MNILIGLLSGAAASMGLGGGFIFLIYLSAFTDTPQDIAQGANLLFFLPIALLSVIIHIKNKLIDIKAVKYYAFFGLLGAAAGSIIGIYIDADILQKLFALLLIFVGVKEVFHKDKKLPTAKNDRRE